MELANKGLLVGLSLEIDDRVSKRLLKVRQRHLVEQGQNWSYVCSKI